LEIGLPDRLCGPAPRRGLRVLDFPGIYAAEAQEWSATRKLLSDYAPLANFIVFVLSGDQFVEQLLSPAITDNPLLANWNAYPDRFLLAFTRAFSNATVREYLEYRLGSVRPGSWDPGQVLQIAKEYFNEELAYSGLRAGNERSLFPIEIGETWRELRTGMSEKDRIYAAEVASVNSRLLGQLISTVGGPAADEGRYQAKPEIASRIAVPDHAPSTDVDEMRNSAGIFISYRQSDEAAFAGRLYDRIAAKFGESQTFKDVDSVELGADFMEELEAALNFFVR